MSRPPIMNQQFKVGDLVMSRWVDLPDFPPDSIGVIVEHSVRYGALYMVLVGDDKEYFWNHDLCPVESSGSKISRYVRLWNLERIDNIDNYDIKEGDAIKVKVVGINERGQISLSRKVLLTQEA